MPKARRTLRANEASLNSYIKTTRSRDAGQHVWVTPDVPARVRELVDAQICPVCGEGPYKLVASHTNRAHGIDRFELRAMCGVNRTASITTDSVRDRYVQIGKAALSDRKRAEGLQAKRANNMAARAASLMAKWHRTDGSWSALERLAAEEGRNRKQLRTFLQNHGAVVPDGRAETTRRRTNYVRAPWRGCEMPGCTRRHNAKGLCEMHYQRKRKERADDPA